MIPFSTLGQFHACFNFVRSYKVSTPRATPRGVVKWTAAGVPIGSVGFGICILRKQRNEPFLQMWKSAIAAIGHVVRWPLHSETCEVRILSVWGLLMRCIVPVDRLTLPVERQFARLMPVSKENGGCNDEYREIEWSEVDTRGTFSRSWQSRFKIEF